MSGLEKVRGIVSSLEDLRSILREHAPDIADHLFAVDSRSFQGEFSLSLFVSPDHLDLVGVERLRGVFGAESVNVCPLSWTQHGHNVFVFEIIFTIPEKEDSEVGD